jgi:hypothetical protein
MTNAFCKKFYNTLKNENKHHIHSIENIDKYVLHSSLDRKLNFYIIGGGIKSNSYIPKDNIIKKERVELDNADIFYYNVERYKAIGEDKQYRIIDLVSLQKKNFDDNDIPCASIQLNLLDKTANIFSLSSDNRCIKSKQQNVIFKYGDIMFQIMLDICKKEGIKYISLIDNSNITCGKYKLNLDVIKTLTQGTTHYIKYGFTFVEKIDIDNYNENKKIFKKNPSINKKILKKIILDANVDKFTTDHLFRVIDKIEHQEISIKKFVLLLTIDLKNENFCKLIYLIYYDLYKIAGYRAYYSKNYELLL